MKKIIFSVFFVIYMVGFALSANTGVNLTGKYLSGGKDLSTGNFNQNVNSGNAIDKAGAINQFMQRERKMVDNIYKDSSFSIMLDVEKAKQQLNGLSDRFKRIVKDFQEVKKRKSSANKKYKDIRDSIKNIIDNIRKNKGKVSDKIIKIKLYTKKLTSLEKKLQKVEKTIDETRSHLVKYTKFLYKLNNDFYGKDLKIDNIKLFVKSNNIASSLSHEDIIKSLTVKLNKLVSELEKKRKKYESYTRKLDELRAKYREEVQKYKSNIGNLEEQKKYLVKLLEIFRHDKERLNEEYEKLYKQKSEVKSDILNMLSVTKKGIGEVNLGSGIDIAPLLKSEEKSDGDNFFSWPVLPVNKISSFFEDKEYKKQFGAKHKATDLVIPQGSEVYAPANGIVYKVVNTDGPSLNWMVMLHKHGYVTVYLHLNQIYVKKGNFVKRGKIIAKSGGKPGTRGAGMLSTDSHLHFEVIKNGKFIDPLKKMDLSIFRFKNKLPEKYYMDYMKDKYSREFSISASNFVRGTTMEQRRINFLRKYAVGPYRKLELWKKAAENTNIDIDLGICIGFAESGLGANMTTKWNIGNVGNNDRGDRRGYATASQGARVIYLTLTNKYLGNHHTINKLSRYDNKNGSIYASDDKHWQKNVMKCLSRIKGYRVPYNYSHKVFKRKNNFIAQK